MGSIKTRNLSCICCFFDYMAHPTSGNTTVLQAFIYYRYISLQSLCHCSQQTFVIACNSRPRMYVELTQFSLARETNLKFTASQFVWN